MSRRAFFAQMPLVLCAVAVASGCDDFFYVCPVADDALVAQLPERLSQTGLYDDIEADQVGADVLSYAPQFELWSDGADKRRFLRIPTGETIDSSDMDAWRFPEGTRVWKEFSRAGLRIETRLLQKVGPADADWASLAYVWNDDGSDAIAAPTGFVDAGGTSHNVPGAGECVGCHGGRNSFVLGVSAIQLSFATTPGELDVVDLENLGLLSDPPAAAFEVPGNDTERAALGYLHANCGHCHNQDRPGSDVALCMDPNNALDLWLTVADLGSPEATPTYRAIGDQIVRGRPGDSDLIGRASSRRIFYRMPPLGSEDVDTDAMALLSRWIEEL